MRDEIDFLHADKHQSFLQVDFDTLDMKVLYKVILSLSFFSLALISHLILVFYVLDVINQTEIN